MPKKGLKLSDANMLNAAGISNAPIYEVADNVAFKAAITDSKARNKFGSSVYVYDEYQDTRKFLVDDGEAGFSLKPDGDVVSAFSTSKEPHVALNMLALAVQEGGTKLDAFNTVLPNLYGAAGFKPVSRVKWADDQAPPDWDKELYKKFNNGEPDVIMMVFDPEYQGVPSRDINKLPYSDYDTAVEIQNSEVIKP